jgi:hypothetical protein
MSVELEDFGMQDQIGNVVVSFIRAQEEADRCEEEYDRVKLLPGFEETAASHLKRSCELKRRASELLRRYQSLKE